MSNKQLAALAFVTALTPWRLLFLPRDKRAKVRRDFMDRVTRR